MTEKTRFAIIGAGVMGEAIIAGLLHKEITTPAGVTAAGPRSARGEELVERYKIGFAGNAEAAKTADVVILSVKAAAPVRSDEGPARGHPARVARDLHHRRRKGFCSSKRARVTGRDPRHAQHPGPDRRGHRRVDRRARGHRKTARAGRAHPARTRRGDLRGGRELPGYGHRPLRHRPGLCVPLHGSHDRRGCAPGLSAAHRRAAGHRRPCAARWTTTPGASSTPPACATRSPPRAAPPPRRSITWKKPASAPPSRAPCGLPTSAARRLARARTRRNRIDPGIHQKNKTPKDHPSGLIFMFDSFT